MIISTIEVWFFVNQFSSFRFDVWYSSKHQISELDGEIIRLFLTYFRAFRSSARLHGRSETVQSNFEYRINQSARNIRRTSWQIKNREILKYCRRRSKIWSQYRFAFSELLNHDRIAKSSTFRYSPLSYHPCFSTLTTREATRSNVIKIASGRGRLETEELPRGERDSSWTTRTDRKSREWFCIRFWWTRQSGWNWEGTIDIWGRKGAESYPRLSPLHGHVFQ
jgi:hypothetical protein